MTKKGLDYLQTLILLSLATIPAMLILRLVQDNPIGTLKGIGSVTGGVLIGYATIFYTWENYETFSTRGDIIKNLSDSDAKSQPISIRRSPGWKKNVVFGSLFSILAVLGYGTPFGISPHPFIMRLTIQSVSNGLSLVLVFFVIGIGLHGFLSLFGGLFDICLAIEGTIARFAAILIFGAGVFGASAISMVMFLYSPFFLSALMGRYIASLSLANVSEKWWHFMSKVIIVLVILLPILAYLPRFCANVKE